MISRYSKHLLGVALSIFFASYAFSQNNNLNVYASSGGFEKSDDMSISWTFGENFIRTLHAESDFILTQGFQQSFIEVNRIIREDNALEVELFPNPSDGIIYIRKNNDISKVDMFLMDISGRQIGNWQSDDFIKELDLSAYPSGSYIIQIMEEATGKQASYQIILK